MEDYMNFQIFKRGTSRKYQIQHGGHNITLLVSPGNEQPPNFEGVAPYLSSDQPGQDATTSEQISELIRSLEWLRGRL
jgi:hypothetical protein